MEDDKKINDELKIIDERLCVLEKKFDYIIMKLTSPKWSITWEEMSKYRSSPF